MTLEYELTLDDVVRLGEHVNLDDGPRVPAGAVVRAVLVAAAVALLVRQQLPAMPWAVALLGAVGLGAAWLVLEVSQRRVRLRRYLERVLGGPDNRFLVGWRRLSTTESGFTVGLEDGEFRHAWRAVRRFERVPGYVYIFVSAAQAHIVPIRDALSETDADALVAELRTHTGAGKD